MFQVGILTCSDRGAQGEREDTSALAIREMLPAEFRVVHYQVVPDEQEAITAVLVDWCDGSWVDLIFTTGGTGLTPRDVTPEATLAVIERLVPGIAEAMRAAGLAKTPHAMLSRAVAGVRRRTLIINLPGSPKAVRENLAVVLPALPHAIDKIKGADQECGSP